MGFVEASFNLYYRYLNLGFQLPPSAGSATGVLPNPLGYNRVYVRLNEPFSIHAFYHALRTGQSFVTNGPMLFIETREVRGDKVDLIVKAIARDALDRIEVVANGKILKVIEVPDGRTAFDAKMTIEQSQFSWVAARVFARADSTIRMAHSSPVYLEGHWDMREDALFFIRWIDELIELTRTESDRVNTEAELRSLINLYQRARQYYEDKLNSASANSPS